MHRIWQKAGQNQIDFNEIIIRALIRSGTMITLQNLDLEYLFAANLPDPWKIGGSSMPTDRMMFGEEIASRLEMLKSKVLASGEMGKIEANVGSDATYEFVVELVTLSGDKKAVITTIIDLTEERRREAVLKSLLREVSHRSKNMLAIVQSMANQTARAATSLDTFIHIFRGRIQSLSFSQDLVTAESWRGADLFALIDKQTSLYLGEGVQGIKVSGDDVRLTPNGVTHIGLAVHELTLNAATRGTLDAGKSYPVELTAKRNKEGEVVLEWVEDLTIAENVSDDPLAIDLDSVLLNRVVPQSLDGKVTYKVDDKKLKFELIFDPDR